MLDPSGCATIHNQPSFSSLHLWRLHSNIHRLNRWSVLQNWPSNDAKKNRVLRAQNGYLTRKSFQQHGGAWESCIYRRPDLHQGRQVLERQCDTRMSYSW